MCRRGVLSKEGTCHLERWLWRQLAEWVGEVGGKSGTGRSLLGSRRDGGGLVEGVCGGGLGGGSVWGGDHQCQTLGAGWMVVPFIRTDDLRKQQVLFGTRCELPGDPAQWEGWGLQFGAEPSLLGLTHISRGPLGARAFECREGMEI